jgi:hypothetical protein
LKPSVDAHESVVEYCRQNGVTPEKFQKAVQLAALLENDPEQARKELEPIWNQLQGVMGEVLPTDLAEEVEAGTLSEERAKELAKLRNQQVLSTRKQQQQQQVTQATMQQRLVQDLTTAVSSWENTVKTKNPDFQPKVDKAAPDGVYEWWLVKYESLLRTKGVQGPQDAVTLAEEAFKQVNSSVAKFAPAQKSQRALSSTRSATNTQTNKNPSVRDIVYATAAKHGVKG